MFSAKKQKLSGYNHKFTNLSFAYSKQIKKIFFLIESFYMREKKVLSASVISSSSQISSQSTDKVFD
jgi:hypothetical protein